MRRPPASDPRPGVPGAGANRAATGGAFAIMFMCTANLCRSPMADRLAWAALARRGLPPDRFMVFSTGGRGQPGMPMTRSAAQVLDELGVPGAEQFRSSPLTATGIVAADLILTMTRAHRSAVVTADPGALRRSFTLTEFARTATAVAAEIPLPADPVERARAVVASAARHRGMVRPERPDDDDIADPIGSALDVYREAAARIAEVVDRSLTALVGLGSR